MKKHLVRNIIIIVIILGILFTVYWTFFRKDARLKRLYHQLALAHTDSERTAIQDKIDKLEVTGAPPDKTGDNKQGLSGQANYQAAAKNLGLSKPMGSNFEVPFNNGVNSAVFYNNNRVIIFKGDNRIKGGTYFNGGRKIIIDPTDGGKMFSSGSVWTNLENTI